MHMWKAKQLLHTRPKHKIIKTFVRRSETNEHWFESYCWPTVDIYLSARQQVSGWCERVQQLRKNESNEPEEWHGRREEQWNGKQVSWINREHLNTLLYTEVNTEVHQFGGNMLTKIISYVHSYNCITSKWIYFNIVTTLLKMYI